MPRRKARLGLSTPQLREMVPTLAELLAQASRLMSQRMQRDAPPPPKRSRGRGSQLATVQQLAIMLAGAIYVQNAAEVARRFGVDRRTVQRIFRTRLYQKFKDEATGHALTHLLDSRYY